MTAGSPRPLPRSGMSNSLGHGDAPGTRMLADPGPALAQFAFEIILERDLLTVDEAVECHCDEHGYPGRLHVIAVTITRRFRAFALLSSSVPRRCRNRPA